jgi:hypothetical protein
MIAADSSSLVAYFSGERGPDVEQLASAMMSAELILPPVVVTEILTDPRSSVLADRIGELAILDLTEGYWTRAGLTRRTLRMRGFKAKVGDTLIAQSCIDHDVALITRDKDFRHFAKHCGLRLA